MNTYKKKFNYIKDRLIHFFELDDLLNNGQLIRFYPDRAYPDTQINSRISDIKKNNRSYILHLFLRKELSSERNDLFAPVSFIIKSEKDKTAVFGWTGI